MNGSAVKNERLRCLEVAHAVLGVAAHRRSQQCERLTLAVHGILPRREREVCDAAYSIDPVSRYGIHFFSA
jgi:hypothetical protein